MNCPLCGSESTRRLTETDIACSWCRHEWVELPALEFTSSPCESPEDAYKTQSDKD